LAQFIGTAGRRIEPLLDRAQRIAQDAALAVQLAVLLVETLEKLQFRLLESGVDQRRYPPGHLCRDHQRDNPEYNAGGAQNYAQIGRHAAHITHPFVMQAARDCCRVCAGICMVHRSEFYPYSRPGCCDQPH